MICSRTAVFLIGLIYVVHGLPETTPEPVTMTAEDDHDHDDDGDDDAARNILVGNYNAFNFFGESQAMQLLRRAFPELLKGGSEGDGEGGRGGGGRRGGGRGVVRVGGGGGGGGRTRRDDSKDKLGRNNYDRFPDEARYIPGMSKLKFGYGKVPFPTGDEDDDWIWNLNEGRGFGFGPGGKRGERRFNRDMGGREYEEREDDEGPSEPPLDWSNLCINECGEGVPNGFHRKCDDCSMYFRCNNGVSELKDCGNLMFNHVTDQCDISSQVNCDEVRFANLPRTTSRASMTSESSLTSRRPRPLEERMTDAGPFCVDDCFGVPDGQYPSCYGCQDFTECFWGSVWRKSCKKDFTFDMRLGQCRPLEDVECRVLEEEEDDDEGDEESTDPPAPQRRL